MKFKIIYVAIVVVLLLLLQSCGKKAPVEKVDDYQLLAQALVKKDQATIQSLRQNVRLTEDTQNLLDLYQLLQQDSGATMQPQIDYLHQFYPSMVPSHRRFFDQMRLWSYLKQIYQHEISPPVRILQREKLYLAPSNIDFSRCTNDNQSTDCAHQVRNKILPLISQQGLYDSLKKMATNDPCVNLSQILKGEELANRCLKKSKGQLKVTLLPVPRFSYEQWLGFITAK